MFNNYSEIMYKGRYDNPIFITFYRRKKKGPKNNYHMTLTGEGGNSHLILYNEGGSIDLWVDTHCAAGHAFIHSIRIDNEPGARFAQYIYSQLVRYCDKVDHGMYYFSLSQLNKFFADIYRDMLNMYITTFYFLYVYCYNAKDVILS